MTKFDRPVGPACAMTWGPDGNGGTAAHFTVTEHGDLIMHLSGPGAEIGRHKIAIDGPGGPRFTYGFPPSAVTDLGGVLYKSDGGDPLPGGCSISYSAQP